MQFFIDQHSLTGRQRLMYTHLTAHCDSDQDQSTLGQELGSVVQVDPGLIMSQ